MADLLAWVIALIVVVAALPWLLKFAAFWTETLHDAWRNMFDG